MPEQPYPRPDWKRAIRERLGDIEESVAEELAQHLEARYEELGSFDAVMTEWSADDLRAELARIARRRPEPIPAGSPVAGMWRDLRFGLRQLRMNPGFTAVAVLSLALGIGANTAIFQLLDAVRLRTLPVNKPEDLATVRLDPPGGRCCEFTSRYPQMTYALWEQVRDHQQAFTGVLAWSPDTLNLSTDGEARLARNALWVSGDFFQVLGVQPLLGRVFTSADDRRGCAAPGAVLGYGFWQREFGGDPSAIGRNVHLNGHPVQVIGVTPASFYGVEVGHAYDLAVPLCADPIISGEEARLDHRDTWWLAILGRLKPGWTVERASAHLAAISPSFFESSVDPKWNPEVAKKFVQHKMRAAPAASGVSDLRNDYQDPLWLLLAITGLVLLIACANLANLLLARASAREREIAVRLALGASRPRLVRQLMLESLLLAIMGTAVGAFLARIAGQALIAFLSNAQEPLFLDLSMDWRLFAFLSAAALLTCMIFGLAPALRATRTEPAAAMKTGSRSFAGNRSRFGLRRVLVTAQVAVSLVLLVGALLFVRTLRNLVTLNTGFQRNGILVAQMNYDKLHVPETGRLAFRNQLLEQVRAVPGVEGAASSAIVPVSGASWSQPVRMDLPDHPPQETIRLNRVSPGFFTTLGTPLIAGRDLSAYDIPTAPPVALVNETFARTMNGGKNPVGQRFFLEDARNATKLYEIVGLVKDAKYADLREDARPVAYLSAGQDAHPDTYSQILIRSSLPLDPLLGSVRDALRSANPGLEFEFHALETQIQATLVKERMMALLAGSFGVLAVLLAIVGLYGVISFTVAQRTQEIGVRMALGANRARIAGMILGEAGWLLAAGLAAGTALALYVVRVADKMLYGLSPQDPWSFTLSAAMLAAVAAVASYLPARRAARLDPMTALREE
jgi:putative ABC transport system permease protein